MKTPQFIFFVLFLLVFTSGISQQYSENNSETLKQQSTNIQDFVTTAKKVPDNIKGTPFQNDDFQPGSILNDNQVLISSIVLRYNAFQDEFQIKKSVNESNDNIQALLKKTNVYIKVSNDIYAFKTPVPNEIAGGYYQILVEGNNLDLYKKNSKKYIEGAESVNMMTGNHASRLVDESFYFVVNSTGKFVELPSSKNKKIETIAGSQKNELKKYIKSAKLNIKNEEDLIKAIEFFNSQS